MNWARYFLIVCVLFCSCQSKQITPVVKQPFIDNRERWKVLAIFVQNHFDTGDKSISEIAADLSLAEYYLLKEENEK